MATTASRAPREKSSSTATASGFAGIAASVCRKLSQRPSNQQQYTGSKLTANRPAPVTRPTPLIGRKGADRLLIGQHIWGPILEVLYEVVDNCPRNSKKNIDLSILLGGYVRPWDCSRFRYIAKQLMFAEKATQRENVVNEGCTFSIETMLQQ